MLHADNGLSPWLVPAVRAFAGGPVVLPRSAAPLGRLLPYRRSAGAAPSTGQICDVRARGWSVDLGDRGLGDVLLALAMVRALHEVTGPRYPLEYRGSRAALMRRCELPMRCTSTPTGNLVRTATPDPVPFTAVPEEPPAWLDLLDDDRVEVHAALPMRYYLHVEIATGQRLPASSAPTPMFASAARMVPQHVVFVSATSRPDRKDYGLAGFARVAEHLAESWPGDWRFTLITAPGTTSGSGPSLFTVLNGPDATDCIDVFASANVAIGNDTGLTHLAALTVHSDSPGPHVIGLYGRHAYNKWTTGAARHHAIATPFSQLVAAADRCPVRDLYDDAAWNGSADLSAITPRMVAQHAALVAGWSR